MKKSRPKLAKAKKMVKKNAPTILTVVGIAGMVASTAVAVKTTPKAVQLLDERAEELEVEEVPVMEVIKTVGVLYVPAISLSLMSILCIVKSDRMTNRRFAAAQAACAFSERALLDYKRNVQKVIGEKKEAEIRESLEKEKIANTQVDKPAVIMTSSYASPLCLETYRNVYFKCNFEDIRSAFNDLNKTMISQGSACLNDLYMSLGVPLCPEGDEIGWNLDDGLVEFFPGGDLKDGIPCITISYDRAPIFDYDKVYR